MIVLASFLATWRGLFAIIVVVREVGAVAVSFVKSAVVLEGCDGVRDHQEDGGEDC